MLKEEFQAYIKRIGFTEKVEPSLYVLGRFQFLQSSSMPFENLNPLLDIPIHIDLPSLMNKMIYSRRGGYCYEQNSLLLAALRYVGFEVTPITGRVWGPHGIATRTHMVLLVHIDGQHYTVDTGYGGLQPPGALRLEANTLQETTHETYRFLYEAPSYALQALVGEEWRSLYTFDLQWQGDIDFKVGNWYTSTHPDSSFKRDIKMAIVTANGRYTLQDNRFTTYVNGETPIVEYLKTVDEIKEVLQNQFKLNLVNLPGLDKKLQQILDK